MKINLIIGNMMFLIFIFMFRINLLVYRNIIVFEFMFMCFLYIILKIGRSI